MTNGDGATGNEVDYNDDNNYDDDDNDGDGDDTMGCGATVYDDDNDRDG